MPSPSAQSNSHDVFQWTDLFEDYFGHALENESALRWYSELEAEYHGLTNDQLCSAIRRGHRTYTKMSKPNLADLFRWMREYRRETKSKKCKLCDGTGKVYDAVNGREKRCPDCGEKS
jgi:hypothetical protein